MLNEKEKIRYARHLVLPEVGQAGQEKLKAAKLLVIGAGGLGCPVLQYLVAAGVGKIGVIDHDMVDESNLQRQILFSNEDVGRYKAVVAKEKLEKQNPYVSIVAFCEALNRENALQLTSGYDLVVDGSDNFATRYLVNDACMICDKPLVFGSIFKFSGQVTVFNYAGGPTYRCLYPEPPAEGDMPSCAETGVIGVLPGICGTLMANEVIKIITGLGDVLSGTLLSFNSLTVNFEQFNFVLDPENKKLQLLNDYEFFCGSSPEITANELKKKLEAKEDLQLIDVREESEYKQKNIGGTLIPLGTLENNYHKIDPDRLTVVHCASGIRSKKAVQLLREKGLKKIYNLKNGLLDF